MRALVLLACVSSCSSGPATATVVTDVGSNVNAIGLAGSDLYVATADQTIVRVATTTGATTPFIASEPAGSLATDATSVVWHNAGSRTDLRRAPLGDATQATTVADPVTLFAVDDDYVYFWDKTNISRAPIGGGATTTLAAVANVTDLASDGTQLYYGTQSSGSDANVYAMPRDGGVAKPLSPTAFGGAYDLRVDDKNVYLLQASGGGLTNASAWFLSKTGGVAPGYLDFDCATYVGLALSSDSVYLVCSKGLGPKNGPTVQRVAKDGNSQATIGIIPAADASTLSLTAPVVDATNVYFGAGTSIMKVAR